MGHDGMRNSKLCEDMKAERLGRHKSLPRKRNA